MKKSRLITEKQVQLFKRYSGDKRLFVVCADAAEKKMIDITHWEIIEELVNDFQQLCLRDPDKFSSRQFQTKLDTYCEDEETKELIRFVSHYLSKQRMSRTKALDHSRQADVAVRLLNRPS